MKKELELLCEQVDDLPIVSYSNILLTMIVRIKSEIEVADLSDTKELSSTIVKMCECVELLSKIDDKFAG